MSSRLDELTCIVLLMTMAGACAPQTAEYEERGDKFSAEGEYADAQVEYRLAIEASGEHAPPRLRMKAGSLSLRSKDFTEANLVFEELVETHPPFDGRIRALYRLHAEKWAAEGDTFASLRAIEWLRSRDSTASLGALNFIVGDAAYQEPDYDRAIVAYIVGLAQAPDQASPTVYAHLGDAYERKHNCAAAIQYFERYVARESETSTELADIRYRLGACSLRLAERAFTSEDLGRAREYLELTLEIGEPVSRVDDADFLMARIYERVGNRTQAMEHYSKIVERSSEGRSRTAVEAYRRLKQLEFGMPLREAEESTFEEEGT